MQGHQDQNPAPDPQFIYRTILEAFPADTMVASGFSQCKWAEQPWQKKTHAAATAMKQSPRDGGGWPCTGNGMEQVCFGGGQLYGAQFATMEEEASAQGHLNITIK